MRERLPHRDRVREVAVRILQLGGRSRVREIMEPHVETHDDLRTPLETRAELRAEHAVEVGELHRVGQGDATVEPDESAEPQLLRRRGLHAEQRRSHCCKAQHPYGGRHALTPAV